MRKFALLALIIFSIGLQNKLKAQSCGVSAVYGGGPIYLHDTTTIPDLRASGFTTVVVWTIHIATNGDLNFNAEFPVVSNGQYIGTSLHPSFASNMALLKTQPTTVKRIEFGLAAWGSSTFANIKTLIAAQGTGPTSILYKNFKALKDSIPTVDAFNFDDETTYDVASSVQFAVMLADLGFKVALCPYTSSSYWTSVASQTNTQRPGTVDAVFLQCYSGGSSNSPCSGWSFSGIPIYPGLSDGNYTPTQVHTKMTTWKSSCSITGGFMWLYDDFYGTALTAQYAAAVTLSTTPAVTAINTSACSGSGFTVTPVNGTNGTVPTGTTYVWSAPVGTGFTGGAAGSGSSITGTLTNTTNAAINATYSVTPTASGCSGTPFSLTVTINPKPAITAMTYTAISGTAFTVSPVNSTNGTVPAGTFYAWTAPTGTGFTGGAAGSGSSINGTLTNSTGGVKTANYTVTPTTGSCTGVPFIITVTVNPALSVSAMTTTSCSGTSFTVTPVNGINGTIPTGTTYSWTAPTGSNITGGASGSGSSITGTLTNSSNIIAIATYTVTPTANGYSAATFTVTDTVYPTPSISNINSTICSGSIFNVTPAIGVNGIVPTGTTYIWITPDGTGFTGGSAGGGSSITGTLIDTTNTVKTATYFISPSTATCTGAVFKVTLTLNPAPAITSMNTTTCSNAGFTATPINTTNGIVPSGTTYSWGIPTGTGINGGTTGTNNSNVNGTLTNLTKTLQTASYTVTPKAGSCTGIPFTLNVNVNAAPSVTTINLATCTGSGFTATPVNDVNGVIPTGTTYSWTNPVVTGNMTGGASGINNTNINGVLTNTTSAIQTATYTVTPTSVESCSGTPFTVSVNVNPSPTDNTPVGSRLNIDLNGVIKYWNGSSWVVMSLGLPGQTLQFDNCNPAWINNSQGIITAAATYTSGTTATSGGTVKSDGGSPITAKGVCWNASHNPSLANNFTTDDIGKGSFTSTLTGLNLGTTYYVRAYATNSIGTVYGNEISFNTQNILPSITTSNVSTIASTTATGGGTILNNGGATITASGVCWSTTSGPTIANNITTDGSTSGTFTSAITGLTPVTTYYVRAYATNSVGTAYGNEISFTTTGVLATLYTTSVSNIATTTANSGGYISNNGGATITSRGVCWGTSANPTTANSITINGSGSGSFTSSLTGLVPGITYYVRAYAINNAGTAYGNQISFTTLAVVPTVTTTSATSITSTTALSGGNVTNDGGATTTARGVCWSTTHNPTTTNSHTSDGTGTGTFTSSITGLTTGTIYYVRAYATNSAGTAYGTEISFTTP